MTEVVWDGKYVDSKKVAPIRIALPFQTVETINESAQDRLRTLELFAAGRETEWRNRLIWGDKKYVLPSLLPEFGGKVNLIYIDPPFDTGDDFSYTATIPDYETEENETSFVKEPSILEQKAFRDTWGRGLDSYLHWFYETAVFLRELLTEDGSIYVHLDWRVNHYVKAILDEVFGEEHFRNEIIWYYKLGMKARSRKFHSHHDNLLWYTKGGEFTFHEVRVPLDTPIRRPKIQFISSEGRARQMHDELRMSLLEVCGTSAILHHSPRRELATTLRSLRRS